jgi:hypothetical protein
VVLVLLASSCGVAGGSSFECVLLFSSCGWLWSRCRVCVGVPSSRGMKTEAHAVEAIFQLSVGDFYLAEE